VWMRRHRHWTGSRTSRSQLRAATSSAAVHWQPRSPSTGRCRRLCAGSPMRSPRGAHGWAGTTMRCATSRRSTRRVRHCSVRVRRTTTASRAVPPGWPPMPRRSPEHVSNTCSQTSRSRHSNRRSHANTPDARSRAPTAVPSPRSAPRSAHSFPTPTTSPFSPPSLPAYVGRERRRRRRLPSTSAPASPCVVPRISRYPTGSLPSWSRWHARRASCPWPN
jgi:hypothetical protein